MTRHDITRFAVAALATLAACTARTGPVPATGMPRVAVVPKPVSLQERGGAPFSLRDSTWIVTDAGGDADVTRVANMLAMLLRAGSGHTVNVGDAGTPMTRGQIRLKLDGARSDLGDEGYTLAVTPDSVAIVARRPAGVFYGVQTLRQLFPYQVEQDMALADTSIWKVPAVSVTDRPRFTWRGAMLDVSRHFFTVDEVKQYIDLLALYKMNRLHLHLSDDQGWRIEIKSRPQLTGTSSATQVGGGPGGFYTQADYADIVRYAADRFITIVPEIEMPAHINALLYAFPQVNCGKKDVGNYTGTNVGFSAICPDTAETWAILDDVIREVAGMTPGPWFHIGGDEVQALTPQQYATFIEHAQSIVNKYGKTMIGWDEIQKSRLVPSSIVQMWRPESEKMSAGGQKMILSPSKKVYIDMQYDSSTVVGLHWAAYVQPQTTYDWDPATLSPGITESDILGIEAPLWSETIRNITAAMYLAVPRLPAMAEVAWTPQAERSWSDFRQRIAAHAPRWRLLGINYFPSPQISWF